MRFFSKFSRFFRQSNAHTKTTRRQTKNRKILGIENLEERVAPSVAPTLPPITPNPDVITYGTTPAVVSLNAVDNDPGTSLAYTAALLDPLYTLQQKYGLTRPATYFDSRGQNEWYLINSSLTNVFVLMPSGNLYAYVQDAADNYLTSTLAGPVLATVDPAVYNNPALLTGTAGAPLVTSATSLQQQLYNLMLEFDLNGVPAVGLDARGGDEKYLHSNNGNWYMLLPNDTLVAWNGNPNFATGNLVANLSAFGDVYDNPTMLTQATLPTAVGMAASVNPTGLAANITAASEVNTTVTITAANSFVAGDVVQIAGITPTGYDGYFAVTSATGTSFTYSAAANLGAATLNSATATDATLTLSPVTGFDRSVQVTVTASDGLLSTPQTFTFTVNDTGPSIPTVLAQTASHSVTPSPSFNLDVAYSETPALTYTATVTGDNALYLLEMKLGLNHPDIYHTWLYQGEYLRIFESSNDSNAANGGIYVLTPADQLYAAVLDPNLDLSATLTGANLAADFTTALYDSLGNVYSNPALLYDASLAPWSCRPIKGRFTIFGSNMA